MRLAAPLAALTIAVTLLTGCAGGTGTAIAPGAASGGGSTVTAPDTSGGGADAAAAIVSDRCTRCHSTERIKAAQHDKAAWTKTVDRMRGKGAQLSDTEAAQVVDFLAGGGASRL